MSITRTLPENTSGSFGVSVILGALSSAETEKLHTSVAILDAVKSVGIPTVEVHISDVRQREDFRQVSYVRQACVGTVMGKGFDGYIEAMDILLKRAESI